MSVVGSLLCVARNQNHYTVSVRNGSDQNEAWFNRLWTKKSPKDLRGNRLSLIAKVVAYLMRNDAEKSFAIGRLTNGKEDDIAAGLILVHFYGRGVK